MAGHRAVPGDLQADSAQGVIAGRFHAMIFCLLAGTPFLAVSSTTSKIEAVLDDVFGSSRRLLPVAQIASMSRLPIPAFMPGEEEFRLGYLSAARAGIGQMFDDMIQINVQFGGWNSVEFPVFSLMSRESCQIVRPPRRS